MTWAIDAIFKRGHDDCTACSLSRLSRRHLMRQFYMRRIRAIPTRKLQLRLIDFSPLEEELMAQRKDEQDQCQRADGRQDVKSQEGFARRSRRLLAGYLL